MSTSQVALIEDPERVRAALSPIRRRLLQRLREPSSATQLAGELEMGRQRVNYHLRALEQAGFIELSSERQRRGCVERIMIARATAFIVDPAVVTGQSAGAAASAGTPAVEMARTGDTRATTRALAASGGSDAAVDRHARIRTSATQDRFAAEHLIDTAAAVVRDVARMQAAAQRAGARLLTFTLDTEVAFERPADLERFTTALTAAVARTAARFHAPGRASRRYRVIVGGHPAPRDAQSSSADSRFTLPTSSASPTSPTPATTPAIRATPPKRGRV